MKYLSCVPVMLALLATHSVAAEKIERNVPADPSGSVDISNVAGEVRVIGWDKPEVRAVGNLGAGAERLEVERDGTDVRVQVVMKRGGGSGGSTHLQVHVPARSDLSVTTVSAEQIIENVSGEQRLKSVSGAIRSQVLGAEVEANTVSGEIHLRGMGAGVQSEIDATSVSGSIRLENVGREVDVTTVNGSVDIDTAELSRLQVETTNGSVEVHAALAASARVDAEAINGSLRFIWNGMPAARYDIETFNGRIRNCFGPKPRRVDEHAPGTELRFEHGNGSARVNLKTLNGGIEVCTSKPQNVE